MSGDNQSGTAQLPSTAFDQAAEWFARLQSEESGSATKRRFRQWLRQSPDNVSAFRECQSMWDEIGDASSDPDILAMRNDALTAMQPETRDGWGRITAIAASLCALLISVTVLGLVSRDGTTGSVPPDAERIAAAPAVTIYRTETGQRSTISLPDGSTAELNTDSLMQVNYSDDRRELVLLKGEAFFDVEKDPERPFVVMADDKLVRAVGTEFAVRMEGDAVRVTLVEGVIDVGRAVEGRFLGGAEEVTLERLVAGEQIVLADNRTGTKDVIDTQIATSWRDGRLVFDNDPLSRVVAEVNRYSARKIVLGDASLAEMRISGSFRAGSADGFSDNLQAAFPVTAVADSERNRLFLRWNK
ncbi:FecR family protein [Qipengyuania sp. SS22]|uniref:FecR family protein n=1 Tax=Qipengyuania sp. SS22 TaxID=2979461 RepID=UPI0021E5C28B|nr:FecR family protein [Qipengyuania sp. SS22]UYH55563.1 FecR family protein [Qipengyuania sp. SS22]